MALAFFFRRYHRLHASLDGRRSARNYSVQIMSRGHQSVDSTLADDSNQNTTWRLNQPRKHFQKGMPRLKCPSMRAIDGTAKGGGAAYKGTIWYEVKVGQACRCHTLIEVHSRKNKDHCGVWKFPNVFLENCSRRPPMREFRSLTIEISVQFILVFSQLIKVSKLLFLLADTSSGPTVFCQREQ